MRLSEHPTIAMFITPCPPLHVRARAMPPLAASTYSHSASACGSFSNAGLHHRREVNVQSQQILRRTDRIEWPLTCATSSAGILIHLPRA